MTDGQGPLIAAVHIGPQSTGMGGAVVAASSSDEVLGGYNVTPDATLGKIGWTVAAQDFVGGIGALLDEPVLQGRPVLWVIVDRKPGAGSQQRRASSRRADAVEAMLGRAHMEGAVTASIAEGVPWLVVEVDQPDPDSVPVELTGPTPTGWPGAKGQRRGATLPLAWAGAQVAADLLTPVTTDDYISILRRLSRTSIADLREVEAWVAAMRLVKAPPGALAVAAALVTPATPVQYTSVLGALIRANWADLGVVGACEEALQFVQAPSGAPALTAADLAAWAIKQGHVPTGVQP